MVGRQFRGPVAGVAKKQMRDGPRATYCQVRTDAHPEIPVAIGKATVRTETWGVAPLKAGIIPAR